MYVAVSAYIENTASRYAKSSKEPPLLSIYGSIERLVLCTMVGQALHFDFFPSLKTVPVISRTCGWKFSPRRQ